MWTVNGVPLYEMGGCTYSSNVDSVKYDVLWKWDESGGCDAGRNVVFVHGEL